MAYGSGESAPDDAAVAWSERYLEYAASPYHPMNPVRLALTMALARDLGVLDGVDMVVPEPACEADLLRFHSADFINAVKNVEMLQQSGDAEMFGLGVDDNPVFRHMHEAASVIVGGTLRAAAEIASGRGRRAVSIGGGMHHAMPGDYRSFGVSGP